MSATAAMAKPMSTVYSNTAQDHWKRAEILMPSAATTSTSKLSSVPTRAVSYLSLAAAFEKKLSRYEPRIGVRLTVPIV